MQAWAVRLSLVVEVVAPMWTSRPSPTSWHTACTKVSTLELQLSRAQAALAGLDSKYLSKYGDNSIYSYVLGAIYTNFLQSEMYNNGVGFRLSGNPTATVDDKYNLIIRDVGGVLSSSTPSSRAR